LIIYYKPWTVIVLFNQSDDNDYDMYDKHDDDDGEKG